MYPRTMCASLRMAGLVFLALGGLPAEAALHAQAAGSELKLEFLPDDKLINRPLQLTARVVTRTPLRDARLVVRVPTGFTARPQDSATAAGTDTLVIAMGALTTETARTVMIDGDAARLRRGKYKCLVDLVAADSTGTLRTIASQEIPMTAALQIPLSAYVGLGALGILIGRLLNWFVIALRERRVEIARLQAKMQDDEAAAAPPPGFIKRLVTAHYYEVDLLVMLALGLAVLVAFVGADGVLPEKGSTWYGALLLGFGLGFLTDTDLLTRIKQRAA